MVTIEPINEDVMVAWMKRIKPIMIWIGYDSGSHYLPGLGETGILAREFTQLVYKSS